MSNRIFEQILIEKIEKFKLSFSKTSEDLFFDDAGKLIHPSEFGRYREDACKEFIKFIVPHRLNIGQGFLINTSNKVSHQCDLIIYDSNSTPLIESDNLQRFYPIETVVAVGEVKSVMSKSDLKSAINKLSRVKVLREEIVRPTIIKKDFKGEYDPINIPYDQVFSFLICKKLDFDISKIVDELDSMYEPTVEHRHKHNMILSIEDGIFCYYDNNDKTIMYPYFAKSNLKNRFVRPNANGYCHFKIFSSYLFLGTSGGTILYPDMTHYIENIKDYKNLDEQ